MNIQSDCLSCIYAQVLRVGQTLKLDAKIQNHLMKKALPLLSQMSFELSPPQNALAVYDMIAQELGVEDIYKQMKLHAIDKAKEFIPLAKQFILDAPHQQKAALKVAVAGNVIDLASKEQYDFEALFEKLLEQAFFIDDSSLLFKRLESASSVAYLADNAGENVFDEIFLEILSQKYPSVKFYYFVRSKPIINDITYDELQNNSIQNYAQLIDSGVPTPGFLYEFASEEALRITQNVDFFIAKGMGNYECLSDTQKNDIFFLLKVKCDVVSRSIKAPLGSLICKYQAKG